MNHDSKILERRKAKFSEAARINILNDPLKDKALLSRSSLGNESASISDLKESKEARERLLDEIKIRIQENHQDSNISHGLRKLREIIITLYPTSKNDPFYISFAYDVNVISINYSLASRPCAWKELINSLEFLSERLSKKFLCDEYVACYLIYQAIESQAFSQALHLLYSKINPSKFYDPCKNILQACIVDTCDAWFTALRSLEVDSVLFKFISTLPFHEKQARKTLNTLSKSYKQVCKDFILDSVFHSLPFDWEQIINNSDNTNIETVCDGQIIKFRKV